MAPAGVQNAALVAGGIIAPSPNGIISCTEEYDGSSWSAGGGKITATRGSAGGGS